MSRPTVLTTRAEVRAFLGDDAPGLVPTMGALHDGHAALIRRSTSENGTTVVSVFVNPTQFNDPGDLAKYPRTLDRDLEIAGAAGATAVFAPAVEDIYPPGFATKVSVGPLASRWEGASRPGHFDGVATVVTILLNIVRPGRSYFGEKDYQQLQIIRRFHRDLALPGEIIGFPTIRAEDGLALSSRNARLSPVDRGLAAALPAALNRVRDLAATGEARSDVLESAGRAALEDVPGLAVDYLAIVEGGTLEPLPMVVPGSRLIAAVTLGGVRLIDNLPMDGPA